MTGKERIFAMLNGKTPDYVPIFPKISYATAKAGNCKIGEYMREPEKMAQSIVAAYRKYGWDAVGITTDISLDGMALGSEYEWHEDAPYSLEKYLLEDITQLDRIKPQDPWKAQGHSVVLKATRLVANEIGEEAFVQAWTNGPLNIASQLVNFNELLMGIMDDPEQVHKLLELCTQVSIDYARQLVKAGANAVAFGHAVASANVISLAMYEEFALPYEKRLIDAIHSEGGVAITHICGRIEAIVQKIAQNGSEIIDFDNENDFDRLVEITRGKKIFRGNISPVHLAHESPKEIKKEVKALLNKARGSNCLILGTGCEVNSDAPTENIQAFVDAGREHGKN